VNCSGKSSNLQVETDQTRTPRVAETLRTGIWVDCGYRRRGDGACRPGRGRARFTLRIKGDGRGKTKLLNEYATTSRAFSDAVQRLRRPDADVEAFIRALAETGTAHRACEHSRIKLDKTPDPTWPPALTATLTAPRLVTAPRHLTAGGHSPHSSIPLNQHPTHRQPNCLNKEPSWRNSCTIG
jgi:hypothetical protein